MYSPESCVYYCTLCDYSTKARLNLVQHARSARHQQNEGLRKLHLHQQGLGGEDDGLSLHGVFHVKECPTSQGLYLVNLLWLCEWVVSFLVVVIFVRLFSGCVHFYASFSFSPGEVHAHPLMFISSPVCFCFSFSVSDCLKSDLSEFSFLFLLLPSLFFFAPLSLYSVKPPPPLSFLWPSYPDHVSRYRPVHSF